MWPWSARQNRAKEENEREERLHRERVKSVNNENFKLGGAMVAASGLAAVGAALLCRRSVRARKYIPKTFNANVYPPKYSAIGDAVRAVLDASLLATSFFAFTTASLFWVYNVGSLKQLGKVLTATYSPPRPQVTDEETKQVEKTLQEWLSK